MTTTPSNEQSLEGLIERVKARYTEEPVPPCPVCGASMSIQSAGGGNATVYGCGDHRPFDWKHYERSRWTQFRPGDPDVLEIVSALTLRAVSITPPAPERSKEEVTIDRIKAILDHPSSSPEHDLAAIRQALTHLALEPASLHKEEAVAWRSVPPKPTDQMYVAFRDALDDQAHIYRFVEAYEAMLSASPAPLSVTFQDRVAEAHVALFHDDPTDLPERRDRFYEEATEAAQALGMTEDEAHQLVSYTFSRPPGDVRKEIGAAALTLASVCVVGGWDMMACAEADLAALRTPEKIAKVRAKRATRHGRGPLPGHDPAALSKPREQG